MAAAGATDRLLDLNLSDVQNVNCSVIPKTSPSKTPRDCASRRCRGLVVVQLLPLVSCHLLLFELPQIWAETEYQVTGYPTFSCCCSKVLLKKAIWIVDCLCYCIPSNRTLHSNPWHVRPRYKSTLEKHVESSKHCASGRTQKKKDDDTHKKYP